MIFSWFFLVGAFAYYLTTLGISWLMALLIVAGVNLILLVCVVGLALKFYRDTYFFATRRQLNVTALPDDLTLKESDMHE